MVGTRLVFGWLAIAGLAVTGCGGGESATKPAETEAAQTEAGHEGHDHSHAVPETLDEAVAELAEHRDQLAAGYESNDVKAVDESIHTMGPIARALEGLVSNSGLDRYDASTATDAGKQVLEVLNNLHHGMHGADAKLDPEAYDKEADSLNDAIKNLQAMAEKAGAAE